MCLVLACWIGFDAKAMSTKALYSASVEDLETTDSFFEVHEIRDLHRKIADPVTDLLVIGQAAQSLSQ
ncbi:hypothetical protein Tco_1343712 [Tanacetum coccineum]